MQNADRQENINVDDNHDGQRSETLVGDESTIHDHSPLQATRDASLCTHEENNDEEYQGILAHDMDEEGDVSNNNDDTQKSRDNEDYNSDEIQSSQHSNPDLSPGMNEGKDNEERQNEEVNVYEQDSDDREDNSIDESQSSQDSNPFVNDESKSTAGDNHDLQADREPELGACEAIVAASEEGKQNSHGREDNSIEESQSSQGTNPVVDDESKSTDCDNHDPQVNHDAELDACEAIVAASKESTQITSKNSSN